MSLDFTSDLNVVCGWKNHECSQTTFRSLIKSSDGESTSTASQLSHKIDKVPFLLQNLRSIDTALVSIPVSVILFKSLRFYKKYCMYFWLLAEVERVAKNISLHENIRMRMFWIMGVDVWKDASKAWNWYLLIFWCHVCLCFQQIQLSNYDGLYPMLTSVCNSFTSIEGRRITLIWFKTDEFDNWNYLEFENGCH